MTEPTKTRWYQFDLRFLFLAVTLLAVWLAWQYGRNDEGKSPLAQLLKVGDVVRIIEHGDTCSVKVYSPGAVSGGAALTIQHVDGETIHLKGRDHERAITIASVRSVSRYEPPSRTATGGLGLGGMEMGGGAMDPMGGGYPPTLPNNGSVPQYPLPIDPGSGEDFDYAAGAGAPPLAPANRPGFAQPLPPAPNAGGSDDPSPAPGSPSGGPLQSGGNRSLN